MTAPAHFHETDPSGLQTLERFANATRLNRWMFNTIRPWCKGQVLETGSGIGNISQHFLENNFTLTLSDLRGEYLDILRQKFGQHPNACSIQSIDLTAENFEKNFAGLLEQFDTVVALNVIEHIEDNAGAISNCRKLLKTGGHLIILVPAYQRLYNQFDAELGHYVRYNRATLNKLLEWQDMEVIHSQYFNAVGIIGWMINGSLFRKRLIPKKQLQIFDKLVPVIQLIDTITLHSVGLSVLSVARRLR